MISGIGCDIVAVARIKRAIENNSHFMDKLFTPIEIAYCSSKANPEQSYAARFAAKEAVMKALGTGWDGKINWLDIEVQVNRQGCPFILLYNGAKKLAEQKGVSNIQLSLSHEKEHALAFVVLES
ncbi:MAG: holo-ACP synthase [Candidatus Cloacimonetes bacterium]|nr:holo-ACP synthase [Candidatus Cloacimonadota bacterium]